MLISNDIVSRVRELLSEMKEADLKHQLREAKEDLKGDLINQLHNVQAELTLQIDHAKEGVNQRLDTVNLERAIAAANRTRQSTVLMPKHPFF